MNFYLKLLIKILEKSIMTAKESEIFKIKKQVMI